VNEHLKIHIEGFVRSYENRTGIGTRYRTPLIGFASAADPLFSELKSIASASHLMPDEVLPGAGAVICYFIPFAEDVERCRFDVLTHDSLDRFRCWEVFLDNQKRVGTDVCGKCAVAVPCSLVNPAGQ
jgi:hypothetical protein